MPEEAALSLGRLAAGGRDGQPVLAGESAPAPTPGQDGPLALEPSRCCICDDDDADPLGVGEDFEYYTSPDTFLAMRCRTCGLIYLNPRPAAAEFERIYPPTYHAFDFSAARFGLAFRVRRRLEASRLLWACRDVQPGGRIVDVGCGDGFHLDILREHGKPGWVLEGIDADERAARAAERRGFRIHRGFAEHVSLAGEDYDVAFLIQTVEHLANPPRVLTAIHSMLRPGGRLVIVTDNSDSVDRQLFGGRHWGGYHFPRHWNLFNASTLRGLAMKTGFHVRSLDTLVSPVNWVYSLRNLLVDYHAPTWMVEQFSLASPLSLAAFTGLDALLQLAGRGALLRAVLERP